MRTNTQSTGNVTVRKADDRGHADFGWLDSRHSFSFGDYHDPRHMGFRTLRVINEDFISGGGGFPTHPHRDMEIVTVAVEGALEHKDSMGTGSVIRPGDVQRMSAGTGVTHSEFNHSKSERSHILQIWIIPEKRGLAPSYEQKTFGPNEKTNRLRLIGSRDAREGSVTIQQDVDLYASLLQKDKSVALALRPGRSAWVQVIDGVITVNGAKLGPGDGATIEQATGLEIRAGEDAEFLVFDLA